METKKGFIKKIISKRGFGFIRQEDGTDIFFHAVGVFGEFGQLREGMEVSYRVIEDTGKRPRAIGVSEEM